MRWLTGAGLGAPFIGKIRAETCNPITPEIPAIQPAHKPNIAEEYAKEVAAKTRTGKDGKQYPAPAPEPISQEEPANVTRPKFKAA